MSLGTPPAAATVSLPSFLRDRNYLLYVGANAVSLVGDAAFFVALGWAAAQLGDPFLTSIVLAAGSVPRALLLLPGGALVDRYGVRRLMLGSDLLRAVVMLGGAAAVAATAPGVYLLIAIAVLFGVLDAVYMPAQSSMPRMLLAPEQMTKAVSFNQILYRLGPTLGGPLGGFAVAYGGFAAACLVNGVTFLVVFGALLAVRPRYAVGRDAEPAPAAPAAASSDLHRATDLGEDRVDVGALRDGLRYVRRDPLLFRMLLIGALSNVAVAPVAFLGVVLRAEQEGWGASGLGWLQSAIGLGAVLGALGVLVLRDARRPGLLGMLWIGVQSGCSMAFGSAPTVQSAAVVLFVMGTTFGVASALLSGISVARIDARYLGRTMALFTVGNIGLVPISYLAFGALAGLVGITASCLVAAGISVVTAVWGLGTPVVRDARPVGADPSAQGNEARTNRSPHEGLG